MARKGLAFQYGMWPLRIGAGLVISMSLLLELLGYGSDYSAGLPAVGGIPFRSLLIASEAVLVALLALPWTSRSTGIALLCWFWATGWIRYSLGESCGCLEGLGGNVFVVYTTWGVVGLVGVGMLFFERWKGDVRSGFDLSFAAASVAFAVMFAFEPASSYDDLITLDHSVERLNSSLEVSRVQIKNLSPEPLTDISVSSTCSCVIIRDIPLRVEPYSDAEIILYIVDRKPNVKPAVLFRGRLGAKTVELQEMLLD